MCSSVTAVAAKLASIAAAKRICRTVLVGQPKRATVPPGVVRPSAAACVALCGTKYSSI